MKRERSWVLLPHLFWFAGFATIAVSWLSAAPTIILAAEQETPKDIIAAQFRRQGYACDNPQSAERDRERSKPDEAVWVLHCKEASYRVRLIPDMAARVAVLSH